MALLLKVVTVAVRPFHCNSSVISVLIKVATTVVLFVVIALLGHCRL